MARDAIQRLNHFLRRARPSAEGDIEIGTRQVYILPTAFGVLYALLVLAVLLGATNYGNNPGYLLGFLLGALGLVAMVHTWRNLLGLRLKLLPPAPVFAGQPLEFPLSLENTRRWPRPALEAGFRDHELILTDLPAGEQAGLRLALPTHRRGRLVPPALVVSTRFPLGLLHAWCLVETDRGGLVYPRPAARWEPTGAPDYVGSEQGDRGVGADDFAGHRQYRTGDSPRHIDWKAFAREKGLLSRQFGGDRSHRLWLDWNSLDTADTETALSLLTRGVLDAEYRQQEYGLRLPGSEIPPGRGPEHRHRCLRALALYGEED